MKEYIERKDVYNAIVNNYDVDEQLRALDALPAADVVERKTCYDTRESRIFRCSECGYGVDDIFEDTNATVQLFERFENWRFCPCCGAQIKEVQHGA